MKCVIFRIRQMKIQNTPVCRENRYDNIILNRNYSENLYEVGNLTHDTQAPRLDIKSPKSLGLIAVFQLKRTFHVTFRLYKTTRALNLTIFQRRLSFLTADNERTGRK